MAMVTTLIASLLSPLKLCQISAEGLYRLGAQGRCNIRDIIGTAIYRPLTRMRGR